MEMYDKEINVRDITYSQMHIQKTAWRKQL